MSRFLIISVLSLCIGTFAQAQSSAEKKVRKKRSIVPKIQISSQATQQEIDELIRIERDNYLKALESGRSLRTLFQHQANIQWLENQKRPTSSTASAASGSGFFYKGHFQYRLDSAKNLQGIQNTDVHENSWLRLRTELTYQAHPRLKFQLTPQAVKTFGGDDADGNQTSGSLNHDTIEFFAANVQYNIIEPLTFTLGRQDLAYADETIIGRRNWTAPGQSFDLAKLRYEYNRGWTDFFLSKISNNGTATGGDDADFWVLYNSFHWNRYLKVIDLYAISLDDDRPGLPTVNTLGLLLKGSASRVFYRLEANFQQGRDLGDDGNSIHGEVGYKAQRWKSSVEYGNAGKDYRQLFPSVHRFFGIADVLGRRNINHLAWHGKVGLFSWLGLSMDYFQFERNSTDDGAYQLVGQTSLGNNGNSKDIGQELDLIVKFKLPGRVSLVVGGALFMPGQYMKDQNGGNADDTQFVYTQLIAPF
ncbi:MAG: alginate export family protein [Pseudomonadota bacterium]